MDPLVSGLFCVRLRRQQEEVDLSRLTRQRLWSAVFNLTPTRPHDPHGLPIGFGKP
jgi:hypothetical protein